MVLNGSINDFEFKPGKLYQCLDTHKFWSFPDRDTLDEIPENNVLTFIRINQHRGWKYFFLWKNKIIGFTEYAEIRMKSYDK